VSGTGTFALARTVAITGVALASALGASGCTFRYANAERNIDSAYRRVYLPTATDASARGGQASRVSQAVRRALALDTRFSLVPVNQARVAVDVTIVDSARVTSEVIECKTNQEILAGESVSCADVQKGFALPDASAEKEVTLVDVRVRVVDLTDGRLLYNRTLPKVSSGVYELVGDVDTRRGLKATPQLHALRYVERVDAALERVGQGVAAEIVSALLSLDSYDASLR
jgi:hypothetical protein